ncbi:MAG TPA: MBL fold metallo-hydrolase [Steroidobacteraceae bacterium]|nr:MBL fold metallo-hydrolase [Steroidobacteraceae bacterium]
MTASEPHITVIDCGYVRPRFDASHLIVDAGRAAFVDTGTSHSVPNLLAGLEAAAITPEQVDFVFLTHIHLDHAGGAGALLQHLPKATCVVHPRGARHMIDPARLIAGSIEVYGAETFGRLYGEIVPIPAERVRTVADGERITLGTRELEFLHTPGHALHHYCIVDLRAQVIFSGDTFGLSYREFDTEAGAFIFPTTTPVHFDPAAAHESIDRLMARSPRAIYLTHYSRVTQLDRLAADLHLCLDAFVDLARRYADYPDRTQRLQNEMFQYLSHRLDAHGDAHDLAARHELLDMDVELNVQGLEVWMDRQEQEGGRS